MDDADCGVGADVVAENVPEISGLNPGRQILFWDQSVPRTCLRCFLRYPTIEAR